MSSRPTRLRVAACLAAVVGLAPLMSTPADAAPSALPTTQRAERALQDGPQGYLVETLPDLDTAIETTPAGSVIIAPGATTVRVGKNSIHFGFVIHFMDGDSVTYGAQERIKGKWYDMAYTTKTDPADGCAMGGPGWSMQAAFPGTVRVRGFARQDGQLVVTPSYKVTVKPRK